LKPLPRPYGRYIVTEMPMRGQVEDLRREARETSEWAKTTVYPNLRVVRTKD